MRIVALFFILAFQLLLTSRLMAVESSIVPKIEEFHLCTNKKITRVLRVEVFSPNSCRTTYSKAGIDKNVGSGSYVESCIGFLKNVKTNLESAGWSCKKVETVTTTSSYR